MDQELPGVVEAIATYPSEKAWRQDFAPKSEPPGGPTAATALISLARPLLLPRVDPGDERGALIEVVDLASDSDYASARGAYHEWLRDFFAPLQEDDAGLVNIHVDAASIRLAEEKLAKLLDRERAIVQRGKRADRWTVTEAATIVVGTAASLASAALNPFAWLGMLGPGAAFAGWIAGKRATTPEPRVFSGASMFVSSPEAMRG